jgi:hypothetical protein
MKAGTSVKRNAKVLGIKERIPKVQTDSKRKYSQVYVDV